MTGPKPKTQRALAVAVAAEVFPCAPLMGSLSKGACAKRHLKAEDGDSQMRVCLGCPVGKTHVAELQGLGGKSAILDWKPVAISVSTETRLAETRKQRLDSPALAQVPRAELPPPIPRPVINRVEIPVIRTLDPDQPDSPTILPVPSLVSPVVVSSSHPRLLDIKRDKAKARVKKPVARAKALASVLLPPTIADATRIEDLQSMARLIGFDPEVPVQDPEPKTPDGPCNLGDFLRSVGIQVLDRLIVPGGVVYITTGLQGSPTELLGFVRIAGWKRAEIHVVLETVGSKPSGKEAVVFFVPMG